MSLYVLLTRIKGLTRILLIAKPWNGANSDAIWTWSWEIFCGVTNNWKKMSRMKNEEHSGHTFKIRMTWKLNINKSVRSVWSNHCDHSINITWNAGNYVKIKIKWCHITPEIKRTSNYAKHYLLILFGKFIFIAERSFDLTMIPHSRHIVVQNRLNLANTASLFLLWFVG